MNRRIIFPAMAIIMLLASSALALDNAALIGTWKLVERAQDKDGKPCPFVGEQIVFTADGKMISPNMPAPFRYKVNPSKAEEEAAITRHPELKGMDIMLAIMGNSQPDWSKAPIVYGLQLKDKQLFMKVSGYTLSRYKKLK
jgi:hypothetical protein